MQHPFTIVGLGEVLWDIFPDGAKKFGGAPANFACHAAMLGATTYMVSQVGDDELGTKAIAELRDRGVLTDYVRRVAGAPTGTVEVKLDEAGTPTFTIHENVAWDQLEWSDELQALAERADAVCFGTLGQRSPLARQTMQRFVAATRDNCLRIFDVNLRQHFYDEQSVVGSLRLADALKLNDDELPIVAELCGTDSRGVEFMREVASYFNLRLVALTQGAGGALLLADDFIVRGRAPKVEVVDSVGAGDAFTATMAVDFLREKPLDETVNHACRVAAFVCSQAGATPKLPESLGEG